MPDNFQLKKFYYNRHYSAQPIFMNLNMNSMNVLH